MSELPYSIIKEMMDEMSKENPKIAQLMGKLAMAVVKHEQQLKSILINQEQILRKLDLI